LTKTTEKAGLFQLQVASGTPEIAKIPCIFPDDQGICRGEQFALDCVIRQTVWHVSIHFGEAIKSARGARFKRGRGPGECHRKCQNSRCL